MCGICGIVGTDNVVADVSEIKRMCLSMAHRGPDNQGVIVNGNTALGNRRLRIIDLSGGDQPLTNEDGSLHLIFNGEIYNYKDLRAELMSYGHVFKSRSDSETVLHGYEQWGIDVLNRLIGVFALAIWNSKREELFLARDCLGVKPLYYFHSGDRFLFASEIKAILALNESPRRLDINSLYDWFIFEFVPAPRTLFKGILKVPPGHFILYREDKVSVREYWDVTYPQAGETYPNLSSHEWGERFRAVLGCAVKDRLQADVPVAALLSGGLDSSAVVAMASAQETGPLDVFSLEVSCTEHPEVNEIDFSRAVAERCFATQHTLKWQQNFYDFIEEAVWHAELPVLGNYCIPILLLSRMAREKGFKILLTGDGSDENLAGYQEFRALKILRQGMGRANWAEVAQKLSLVYPQAVGREEEVFKQNLKVHEKYFKGTPWENLIRRHGYGYDVLIKPVFSKPLIGELYDYNPYDQIGKYRDRLQGVDYLNQAIYLENKLIMPNLWTLIVDKMCMANSVEARIPFMDRRVVEFLAQVPPSLKLRGLTEKYLLRKAMAGYLPRKVVSRKKQGIMTPLFFNPPFIIKSDRARHLLTPSVTRDIGVFNPEVVELYKKESHNPEILHRLINICNIHLFCEKFNVTV